MAQLQAQTPVCFSCAMMARAVGYCTYQVSFRTNGGEQRFYCGYAYDDDERERDYFKGRKRPWWLRRDGFQDLAFRVTAVGIKSRGGLGDRIAFHGLALAYAATDERWALVLSGLEGWGPGGAEGVLCMPRCRGADRLIEASPASRRQPREAFS